MEILLNQINSSSEIPEDAYGICNLNSGYFYLKKTDYSTFCNLWIPHNRKVPLTVQLHSTPNHALFFDIDFNKKFTCRQTLNPIDLLELQLKLLFFPAIHNFTIMYASKSDGKGVHIHLPEFTISHDDYLLLCKRLQIATNLTGENEYILDAPINWSFPGVGKPGNLNSFYKPDIIKYITEEDIEPLEIKIVNFVPVNLITVYKKFKRIKKNNDSIFRKLLTVKPNQYEKLLYQFMMPVINDFKYRYKISFATNIFDSPNRETDVYEDVATVTYHCNDKMGYIIKDKKLSFHPSNFLKLYQYFYYHSQSIKHIETDNHALRAWYKSIDFGNENNLFSQINLSLRLDNPLFLNVTNPLKTLMTYDKGYYFEPVFFTLVKLLDRPVSDIIFTLRPMLGFEFKHLLDILEKLNEEYIKSVAEQLTINTIFFCSHNMNECSYKTFTEKLSSVVEKSKWEILGINTTAQLSNLLQKLQERHFPIKIIEHSNMTNHKTLTYVWNALKHCWKEINSEKERNDHMVNLWTNIKNFLTEYRNAGGVGGPDNEIIDKLNLSSVVSTQGSNKSMEQEKAYIDSHKWFVRLGNGCILNLLTKHISGVVPEYYLSNRTIRINIDRPKLIEYLNEDTSILKKMYDLFVNLEFYTTFLEQLLNDETDDIYDTAADIVRKMLSDDWENNRYAKSMLHFYIHLCKFTSFEYDLLLYLLDVLASTLIATNYHRKFYVCKGETSNGKSMLFEIVGRMFGQLYQCILSDNLQKSKNNSNVSAPSPDLALTLFTCRIVVMEELESSFSENRIKQITGDSRVAFRSLFQASTSAVPTAKVFVTTNNLPNCLVSEAFRKRVVAFPFDSTFEDARDSSLKTSEKVMQCLYPKEEYVIESSYEGCFFFLYFHFQNQVTLHDGLVHIRKPPLCVREFTEDFLKNTDVYLQFKCYMDVQVVPGGMTTMTDLQTAIRDFLKEKRADASYDIEIKICFEQEFKNFRRQDEHLSTFQYQGIFSSSEALTLTNENLKEDDSDESDDDDEEIVEGKRKKSSSMEPPPAKKHKTANILENVSDYYENVVIKKLKKSFQFD